MRVDVDQGKQRTLTPHHRIEDSIFPISSGELYGHYRNKAGNLLRLAGDKKLWSLSLGKAMGNGYSPGEGWDINYSEKLGVYSAWIGHESKETEDSKGELVARDTDFAKEMMIGIDAKNGRVLWKAEGATTMCLPPTETANTVLDEGTSYPVRCVFESGMLKEAKGTTGKFLNVKLRLEGFDPKSGKVIWKTKTYAVVDDTEVAHALSDGGSNLILTKEKEPLLLDARTGETRNIAPQERFLCSERAHYSVPHDGAGGTLVFPCDSAGKKTKGVSAGALDAMEPEGTQVVLGFADSVSAYPLKP
jgi:hypothetical protein